MKQIAFYIGIILFFTGCAKDLAPTEYSDIQKTYGFNLFDKVKGIWNGPVTSTTALGNYPEWIVDFRPISPNHISAKNELDPQNDIFMSFFIAKYNDEYRLAFRNGGSFNGSKRVSYFLCDSLSENAVKSYYRFSEILQGKSRAYTEVIFKSDSIYIKSFTNRYNTQPIATPHMTWSAKRQDVTSVVPAVSLFNFPQKTLTKDFSTTFTGQSEAVYYSSNSVPEGDPFPETAHPYLGKVTINYTYSGLYSPDASKKVFILITTQPLISGTSLNVANFSKRSRYVTLPSNTASYTFNYMHPGTYYVYALYDKDANRTFSSGDWVSTTNTSFTLPSQGIITASTQINFTLP